MADDPREDDLNEEIDRSACKKCLPAYTALQDSIAEADTTWIHIDRCVLTAGKKSSQYTQKINVINVLKAKVCALRNTNGGHLMVHVDGQKKEDCCLEKFDEAVERPLKSLITDGSLFTDNYKRQWLSACGKQHLEDFYDCIVLTVKKSTTLCTSNYNTKVTSDLELEPPTLGNIHYILQQPVPSSPPLTRFLADLHESRHLQFKDYYHDVDEDINVLCEKIWKTFRVREYVTAMSNVEKGGSVLIGVGEHNTATSKECREKGFELSRTCEIDLKSALRNKLETVVQLSNNQKFTKAVEGSIDIRFHRLSDDDHKVILEISVGKTDGVSFFNSGPTAYEIVRINNKKKIKKMSNTRWLERLVT